MENGPDSNSTPQKSTDRWIPPLLDPQLVAELASRILPPPPQLPGETPEEGQPLVAQGEWEHDYDEKWFDRAPNLEEEVNTGSDVSSCNHTSRSRTRLRM